ncbi:uncharacterized protein LTR77_002698 [Saxophila tyrrhenica]|uniref:Nudix hydrolase domain-containing protein n=1 Tax=Saxophila tyrrhenica TaxID=1690608 RepID=A0AAV9PJI6_9PEZI|nr:hypothetical protein LTR77_002698 [Saxophila tyrrhenica]
MALAQAQQRIRDLQQLLTSLKGSEYPPLPSPEGMNKRASVALVIRVKPSYAHWPPASTKKTDSIDDFFAQEWVQFGEAEVLFIKRASRKGDRWTSHIALPGGKRDPTDADDRAAAVRECSEEVGLDVEEYGIPVGNLPQRLVTTHWGRKPLLVLCPYLFLLTTHDVPPLKLQPTEVAATHWVPIRSLQAKECRTVAFEDVSSRLANQETGVKRWMLSLVLGKMMFAAISLLPTESLHSAETPALESLQDNRHALPTPYSRLNSLATRIYRSDLFGQYPPLPPEAPLLLWGLTLGVMSDFLDLMPPHNALTLWTYPNFTPLDVRFVVWLTTYRFKARKRAELQAGMEPAGSNSTHTGFNKPAFGYASESIASTTPPEGSTVLVDRPDETGFHGLGTGLSVGPTLTEDSEEAMRSRSKKAAVSTMLEGYYDIVRRAVGVALVGRASIATLLVIWAWRRWRKGKT